MSQQRTAPSGSEQANHRFRRARPPRSAQEEEGQLHPARVRRLFLVLSLPRYDEPVFCRARRQGQERAEHLILRLWAHQPVRGRPLGEWRFARSEGEG